MAEKRAGSTAVTPVTNLTPTGIPEGKPPESYAELGKDYPVGLIAGGLMLGVIAGMTLPRGSGRKLVRGAAALAGTAGQVSQALARHKRQDGDQNKDEAGQTSVEAGEKRNWLDLAMGIAKGLRP